MEELCFSQAWQGRPTSLPQHTPGMAVGGVNTGFLRPGDLPAEESPVQAGGRGLRYQRDAASA
eukprot:6459691-Amphidinium_carterae.1